MSTNVPPQAGAIAQAPERGGLNRRRKPVSDRAKAERKLGWMLCAPAVIVMIAVTAYPIGYSIYLSLLRADLRFPDQREFIGLDNYVTVLGVEPVVVGLLPHGDHHGHLGVDRARARHAAGARHAPRAVRPRPRAHRVADPVRDRHRGRRVRLPAGVLDPVGGFIPHWLGIEHDLVDQGHPVTSFLVVILAEVWKTTPFMALLLLAGLALVPDELDEAAQASTARSAWQRFWRITLPLMKPAILVALLFRTLDAFRIFDSAYIIGQNGTNPKIETVSILGYNQLLNRLNLGLGSAVSVLIFICVMIIALIFIKGLGTSRPGEG